MVESLAIKESCDNKGNNATLFFVHENFKAHNINIEICTLNNMISHNSTSLLVYRLGLTDGGLYTVVMTIHIQYLEV